MGNFLHFDKVATPCESRSAEIHAWCPTSSCVGHLLRVPAESTRRLASREDAAPSSTSTAVDAATSQQMSRHFRAMSRHVKPLAPPWTRLLPSTGLWAGCLRLGMQLPGLAQPWTVLRPHATRGGALTPPGLGGGVPRMNWWDTMHGSPPMKEISQGSLIVFQGIFLTFQGIFLLRFPGF